ncbi:MAG: lamin tail domain-containing protein [Patescibacteria group bacterium]|nr:lamin tail domain-containing protein [Patescibacteria group bacterium]MDD5121319.1 lamin tail domain-containing protein [Patescibacteria group bacterium]MDD5221804.1 lamin tail domain-containing protein [Patescibacteria group bacterium]MDD5395762.1 lamin tail domain-containing protein [Patescibacteria group bacterium]
MPKSSIAFRIVLTGVFLCSGFFYFNFAKADWSNHLVISETQITGDQTTNDFIEVYNPTESAVDVGGWKLHKRTQSGAEYSIKVFSSGKSIPAHGHFLWANSEDGYGQGLAADETSTASIANNNSIGLLDDTDVLIDALIWGTRHINPFFEGETSSTPANPGVSQSLERKPGASDGNGEDTDNNFNDFFLQTTPNPQNSQASSTPPIVGPVCGNDVCESGENQMNCSADCGMPPSGGGGGSAPYEIKSGDILISEIFPEPDLTKNEKEWTEFYNSTNQVIDLNNWTIEDNTAKLKILSNIILSPQQYKVLDSGDFTFTLNNSGDVLILKNGSTIIDKITYGDFEDGNLDDNALRPGKSKSIGRQNGIDTNNDKNDFYFSLIPTPGQANNLDLSASEENGQSASLTSSIFISEFLPNPKDAAENEWVELFNPSLTEVDLSNWQLDDSEGGSRAYIVTSGIKISPQNYLVLGRQQTKLILNNTFDSVRLIRPDKTIQEQIDYKDSPKGASYAKNIFGTWAYTNNPTPGLANVFSSDEEREENDDNFKQTGGDSDYKPIELFDLSDLSENDKIIFQGVVVAPPNMFAKTYFYLNGLQVYCSRCDFPPLEIGDLVEVKGLLSSVLSQHRIKIKQPEDLVIVSVRQPAEVKSTTISDLNEDLIGSLVKIQGQLIDKQGNKFFIDDGNDEVVVSISNKIDIDKKIFKEGQEVIAQGILLPDQIGWKILPRFNSDLIIQNNSVMETVEADEPLGKNAEINNLSSSIGNLWLKLTNGQATKYLIFIAATLALFLFGLFLKLKKAL